MKFTIPIYLTNRKDSDASVMIDMDYNGKLLSLIKLGLSNTNKELFDKLYNRNTVKQFVTSVSFPNAKFINKHIILNREGKMVLCFSSYDEKLALNFYNAFAWLKIQSGKAKEKVGKPLLFGSEYIANIGTIHREIDTPITSNKQVFKIVSPIIVRNRNNHYVSYIHVKKSEQYTQLLKQALEYKLQDYPEILQFMDTFDFKAINMKKVVRKEFSTYVEGTTGVIQLSGNPRLLNYLQESGLGIKTGSFNGMIVAI